MPSPLRSSPPLASFLPPWRSSASPWRWRQARCTAIMWPGSASASRRRRLWFRLRAELSGIAASRPPVPVLAESGAGMTGPVIAGLVTAAVCARRSVRIGSTNRLSDEVSPWNAMHTVSQGSEPAAPRISPSWVGGRLRASRPQNSSCSDRVRSDSPSGSRPPAQPVLACFAVAITRAAVLGTLSDRRSIRFRGEPVRVAPDGVLQERHRAEPAELHAAPGSCPLR